MGEKNHKIFPDKGNLWNQIMIWNQNIDYFVLGLEGTISFLRSKYQIYFYKIYYKEKFMLGRKFNENKEHRLAYKEFVI